MSFKTVIVDQICKIVLLTLEMVLSFRFAAPIGKPSMTKSSGSKIVYNKIIATLLQEMTKMTCYR